MIISAKIIADSIDSHGNRLTTFRLVYPRIILAEVNVHKMMSKNTSSSRAIPVKDNIDRIVNDPFIPSEWVKNARGMYCLDNLENTSNIKNLWIKASVVMGEIAKELSDYELHKQYANRLLEPFMYVDTILSGTDFDNFFYLRIAEDAQPEIQELANRMYEEYRKSIPTLLLSGEWHLPYIDIMFDDNDKIHYSVNGQELDLFTAIKVSVSCCGQVSYRRLNTTIDKALEIYEKFTSSSRVHASVFEHSATPFTEKEYNARIKAMNLLRDELGDDISSIDLEKLLYKRNFKGWTQYRTLVPNDTYTKRFVKETQ